MTIDLDRHIRLGLQCLNHQIKYPFTVHLHFGAVEFKVHTFQYDRFRLPDLNLLSGFLVRAAVFVLVSINVFRFARTFIIPVIDPVPVIVHIRTTITILYTIFIFGLGGTFIVLIQDTVSIIIRIEATVVVFRISRAIIPMIGYAVSASSDESVTVDTPSSFISHLDE